MLRIHTIGHKAWAAVITGYHTELGFDRLFLTRIRQKQRGTGIALFETPESGIIEICFGQTDSRKFVEVGLGHWRELTSPTGKPVTDWSACEKVIWPPTEIMADWD